MDERATEEDPADEQGRAPGKPSFVEHLQSFPTLDLDDDTIDALFARDRRILDRGEHSTFNPFEG